MKQLSFASLATKSECFVGAGECIMVLYQDANLDFKPVK